MSKKDNVRGYDDKKTINWYPGHMAKTKREISEKLNLIDVVYEVVDARMPLSSKIVDINDLIKDKPRIMGMTKYDLCDKTETDKIIKYYESNGYKVIPVSNRQKLTYIFVKYNQIKLLKIILKVLIKIKDKKY